MTFTLQIKTILILIWTCFKNIKWLKTLDFCPWTLKNFL